MYFFFFLMCCNLSVFFGLILIFFQNPLYSILSFICCIFFSTIILFIYGIEFMSFVYLVVYIGAIAVLFLFIIMMLDINSLNILSFYSSTDNLYLYVCIFFKVLYFIFSVNKNSFLFYIDALNKTFFIEASRYSFIFTVEPSTITSSFYDYWNNNTYTIILYYMEYVETFHSMGTDHGYTLLNELLSKNYTDTISDQLYIGLDSISELSSFCLLYNTCSLHFILAGFILLFALLGSISLCFTK